MCSSRHRAVRSRCAATATPPHRHQAATVVALPPLLCRRRRAASTALLPLRCRRRQAAAIGDSQLCFLRCDDISDEETGRRGWVLLDLACSRRLLGEKVRSQGVLFCGFWKGARVIVT